MPDIKCPTCGEPVDEADEEQWAAEPCDNCEDNDGDDVE